MPSYDSKQYIVCFMYVFLHPLTCQRGMMTIIATRCYIFQIPHTPPPLCSDQRPKLNGLFTRSQRVLSLCRLLLVHTLYCVSFQYETINTIEVTICTINLYKLQLAENLFFPIHTCIHMNTDRIHFLHFLICSVYLSIITW